MKLGLEIDGNKLTINLCIHACVLCILNCYIYADLVRRLLVIMVRCALKYTMNIIKIN